MDFKSMIRAQDAPDTKAIPAHPALLALNQQPAMMTTGSERTRTPFGQREAARHLNAYGGSDDAIDWVMDCVKLIIETASSADWHFEKEGEKYYTKKGPDIPTEAKEPPYLLKKLFESPNPYMGLEELIELTLIDYLLVGNAYWLKWRTNDAGQPLALYRMAPPYVKVVPGPFGVESYKYQIPGHDPMDIPSSEVMHFRMANPHSPYIGLGLIQGASRMLDLELALTDTAAGYYEKRAQPSMVVQSDRRVPKEVFKRLQSQLRTMYGGPRNAGALMVLEAGLKYQAIAPNAMEAGFENITKLSRDRILGLFRVPASLLGIQDTNASQQSNSDQRVFDQKTMRPLLNKFQHAVTKGITSAWDMDWVVDYDYIMPVEERLRLASVFAALPGVKVREVREYAGLPPLGEEIDEYILNLPGEEEDPGGHPKVPSNNLQGQGGRPPNSSNTRRFNSDGSLPAGSAVRKPSLAAGDNKKSFVDSTAVDMDMEETLQRLEAIAASKKAMQIEAPNDTLRDDRDSAVDGVVATLTDDIEAAVYELERGLLDELNGAYEGKAPGDRLRSRIRNSVAWKKFQAAFTVALEKAARSAISTAVIQQGQQGRKTEELDYEAIARSVVHRTGGVRKITANFKDDVASELASALKNGETKADLVEAITKKMDKWREGHAETVAMTEAVHAYNEGTLTVAELTGHTHVYVFDGEDDDEPCKEANGQIWPISSAREKRLEHPRCRRAFTPVSVPQVT